MEAALADEQVLEFERPRDMVEVEVCRQTGMLPTPYCGETHERDISPREFTQSGG